MMRVEGNKRSIVRLLNNLRLKKSKLSMKKRRSKFFIEYRKSQI